MEKSGYRDLLLAELGAKGYNSVSKGYDILGNIAVIDADSRLAKRVAKIVLSINKNVTTVINKGGAVRGRYRLRKYKYVSGKKTFTALYRENGCIFKFDVRKTFFSPRLGFERNRISSLVKKGENVIVMFAGVGPFAIEIAKRVPSAKVVAIELNKNACSYMADNIRLNGIGNIEIVKGDAGKVPEKYLGFADRIIMPLPKDSYKFLDSVAKAAKKKCTVHYYAFGKSDGAFEQHIKRLKNFFSKNNASIRIIGKRTVRSYSAEEIEIVLDFLLRSRGH